MTRSELFRPQTATIADIRDETSDIKTFFLDVEKEAQGDPFTYKPGQFVMLSLLGYGEAPISITSGPHLQDQLQLSIKKVGTLTGRVHSLNVGDRVGIRGPYGNGFPVEESQGKDILFVGGGIGLAPLRSVIQHVFNNRSQYGRVVIVYGARSPEDLVFTREYEEWASQPDTQLHITVDAADDSWDGNVGVVTTLLPQVDLNPDKTRCFVCGPPVMLPYVITDLMGMGYSTDEIILTMERHMKCGVGKCMHCYMGGKYICTDGPVFTYEELRQFSDL